MGTEDLRSGVILQEVPVQSQRCELAGITPLTSDGKWPYHTLVHMHEETVGTSCSFEIQARSENKYFICVKYAQIL